MRIEQRSELQLVQCSITPSSDGARVAPGGGTQSRITPSSDGARVAPRECRMRDSITPSVVCARVAQMMGLFLAAIIFLLSSIRNDSAKNGLRPGARSKGRSTKPFSKRMGRHLVATMRKSKGYRRNRNSKKLTGGGDKCSIKLAVCFLVLLAMASWCNYAQWDPYNAIKVGQASLPGPGEAQAAAAATLTITTRNVHGIMSNLMGTLKSETDVICVQETDVAEANVVDITAQAAAAGYTAVWGETTAISKDGGVTTRGRRTAIW